MFIYMAQAFLHSHHPRRKTKLEIDRAPIVAYFLDENRANEWAEKTSDRRPVASLKGKIVGWKVSKIIVKE